MSQSKANVSLDKLSLRSIYGFPIKFAPASQGVEIELEFSSRVTDPELNNWDMVADGSLKGYSGEFVMNAPVPLEQGKAQVVALYQHLRDVAGVTIRDSMRAGTHVHVNMAEFTPKQVMNVITASWMVEGPMIRAFAGKEREGNLFCLRLSDAEGIINFVASSLRGWQAGNRAGPFPSGESAVDNLKYSATNVASLAMRGSLEFRALRSPATGPEPILTWMSIIDHIVNAALNFDNPLQMIETFSGGGPEHLGRLLMGPYAEGLQFSDHMVEVVSILQPEFYRFNWS